MGGYQLAYYLVTTSLVPCCYLVTSSLYMASRWLVGGLSMTLMSHCCGFGWLWPRDSRVKAVAGPHSPDLATGPTGRCPVCQDPTRVVALIDDPRVAEKILPHLGAWHAPPAGLYLPGASCKPDALMTPLRSTKNHKELASRQT